MKIPDTTRLMAALNRADIAPHVQREVFNAYFTKGSNTPGARDYVWRALLDSVRHVRRMLLTNKSKWAPAVAPLYQEYIDILSVVAGKIEQAQIEVTPDGEPMTVAQFTTQRSVVNTRRIQEGKSQLAVCGTKWQHWIPAHVRRTFATKITTYYDSSGMVGSRFTPFITRELKAEDAMCVKRIDSAIKNLRRAMANMGTSPPMADNLLGALYLAAARQAERALLPYRSSKDILENPCPVNWMHLLEPRMRARIAAVRAADRDGEVYDIPTSWASDFYMAPGGGQDGEDPLIIRDTTAVRELAQEIDASGIDDTAVPLYS